MSYEESSPESRSNRNSKKGERVEVYVGNGTEYTVPASMFIQESKENRVSYEGLRVPSFLKLIIEKPCSKADESAVLVFEATPEVASDMPGSLYMLSSDDLTSENDILPADLQGIAQWIPADGTVVPGPGSTKSFDIKSNEQGDLTVVGCEQNGTLLFVPRASA